SVDPRATNTDSTNEVVVILSEPIQDEATFRINNETVEVSPAGPTSYIISDLDLAVGADHELEILNAVDYAENKVQSLTESFTVEKDAEVENGDLTGVQDNKVLVKFDKPVVAEALDNVRFFTYDAASDEYFTSHETTVEQVDDQGKEW